MAAPFFSIVTPSYNMRRFLPICCNSVRDQDVDCEHIVVDGASTDGTVEWLESSDDLISISEEDDGMYDAINKGIQLSRGEIIAYLNCDEQYLPGTLKKVSEIFEKNSMIDILFGNTLIIRPNGDLLACRKSFVPRWPYIWASHMYVHSSSMFVRNRVFDSGIMFDKSWKTVGDADFVVRVLRNGFFAQHVNDYFSAFMLTGSNLGSHENALMELKTFRETAPFWLRHANSIAHALIRFEKFWNGAYSEKFPFSYSVYSTSSLDVRSEFVATSASSFFPQET
jgi:glycosyltransferase involved in cell wall biosynthesis